MEDFENTTKKVEELLKKFQDEEKQKTLNSYNELNKRSKKLGEFENKIINYFIFQIEKLGKLIAKNCNFNEYSLIKIVNVSLLNLKGNWIKLLILRLRKLSQLKKSNFEKNR